jgi:hypothetical protein
MIIFQVLVVLILLNLVLNWKYKWILWIIFGILLFINYPLTSLYLVGGILVGFTYKLIIS